MQKIMIVEDDESIREIVIYALKSAGYDVTGFESGDGFFDALDGSGALVLLDVMLPGQDGLSILKTLRANPKTKALPVIMLTAKGSELDKVKGLDFGADDYITKPFGVMELISRVGAVLRRSGCDRAEENELLVCAGITLDKARRVVSVEGETLTLTYKEYELLYYLMLNIGLALTREQIMREVWGYDFEGESRTLDMHIRTLRHKLGEEGELIQTVRNVGYKLTED